ncbi:hypothetical protein D9C01_13365 [Corynebacterium diphtheriae]|nr:hypothetical protein D9C01_13365 [Corynebacterium diphtheriae]
MRAGVAVSLPFVTEAWQLAYDIAGSDAGIVMGTVMAIKMVAYVLVSPVTTALVSRLPPAPC